MPRKDGVLINPFYSDEYLEQRREFVIKFPDGQYQKFTGRLGSFAFDGPDAHGEIVDIEVVEVGSIYDAEGAD